jgi:hypothetical protein
MKALALCALAACGFQEVGHDAAMHEFGDLGSCASLVAADLASSCHDPGPGTCVDVVSCVTACTVDTMCADNCWAGASPETKTLAQNYLNCRTAAVAADGPCYSSCQDATVEGQATCIACIHVCNYDSSCTYGCSCGACAFELAACYANR